MYRYFTRVGNRRWKEVLPKLIFAYNASVHRSTKMAPQDVNKRNEFNLRQAQEDKQVKTAYYKPYKQGDYVRVSRAKQIFAKGYETQWTEVFVIAQVIKRVGCPVTYKLQDYEGTLIDGSFYHEEVQRVGKPQVYRVEHVLRTKKLPNRQISRLVKWVGYKQPTWTTSDIVKI